MALEALRTFWSFATLATVVALTKRPPPLCIYVEFRSLCPLSHRPMAIDRDRKHWSPFRRLASLGHHMQKWGPSRGLHLGLSWALFSPMWADDRTWAESLTLAGFQRIWHGRGMHPTTFGDVAASQIIRRNIVYSACPLGAQCFVLAIDF